jgi:hypothetical protein
MLFEMDLARIKTITYVPRHINNRYINSYYPGWQNTSVVVDPDPVLLG